MKRKEVIQHYVRKLITSGYVPLLWVEPTSSECPRDEGKIWGLWARTETQGLYQTRKKLKLRSHGNGRILDDRTFCIHETVRKFRSVEMELITGWILRHFWVFYRLLMCRTLLNPEQNGVQCFCCFDVFDLQIDVQRFLPWFSDIIKTPAQGRLRACQVRYGLHICEIMLCNEAVILSSTAINKPTRSIFVYNCKHVI